VAWPLAGAAGCGGGEIPVDLRDRGGRVRPDSEPPATPRPEAAWYECQGSEQAFVRRAYQAILGERPRGQAEVNALTDLIAAIDQLDGTSPQAARPRGPASPPTDPPRPDTPLPVVADLRRARRVVVDLLARRDGYRERWIDVYRDALRVQRLDVQANPACYDATTRGAAPSLVALVRDQPPDVGGGAGFTLRDLFEASLDADDVSPIYLANLFGMMARSYAGANADPVRRELARRSEFGAWFGASYLHRDIVCLGCHNSEASVTFSDDPAQNRFFALPGRPEASLFGASTGPAAAGRDDGPTRASAVLRFTGLSDTGYGISPWNMASACGQFTPADKLTDDPAHVDGKFGALVGQRASVWGLAASLQAGFRKLRTHGLARGPDGAIPDPDEAFAYLVSASIVEQVWREVIGTPLTIAHYFPRNLAARDTLLGLTEGFIASGYSHRSLLAAILGHPAFNLLPPSASCGAAPYAMPALHDPWVTAETDPRRRGNGPGDGVAFLGSRTLDRLTRRGLGWPEASHEESFPASREATTADAQADIGIFLRNVEPGFRGLDFQALLAWQARVGACARPAKLDRDLVDTLLAAAARRPGSQARDLIVALKDRLLGEPALRSEAEIAALEAMVGPLDDPAAGVDEGALRAVCGALLSSPQHLLQGHVPPDARTVPALTADEDGYEAVCQRLAAQAPDGLVIRCAAGSLSVGVQGK
jgi:hypothetical protein